MIRKNMTAAFSSHRRIAVAVALLGMSLGQSAMAQPPTTDLLAKARAAGTIRIANTQSSAPWSMLDDKNQPSGYDVDVARELAKRIGIAKVVFVADTYKNFVEGLRVGKYEIVMNDLTPTTERSKLIDFSMPYGVEDFRIFVRSENTTIRSRADLAGKRVGATSGTTNESWARANLLQSDVRGYDNGGFVYSDLANRRIDAVISSHFGGMKYATVHKLPVKEVGEPLIYQLSAAGIAKGQPALMAALNKGITSMIADGTIDRLGKKWVGAEYQMQATIIKGQQQGEIKLAH
jgi:cystine transport system substrate-binding protein